MEFSEPWYLTIVCTQGIQFIRPEKSWRPIVSVTVVEHDRTHETVLGCDGRNPNLRAPIELQEVHNASRLDIKVWHKSQTKKSRRKKYLIGSAYITLGEILRRGDKPGANVSLNLKCPPAQKRSPTVGGTRQLNCAIITLRLSVPTSSSSSSHHHDPSTLSSRSATLVTSAPNSDYENEEFSDDALLQDSPPDSPMSLSTPQHPPPLSTTNTLRKRTKRKRQKLKAYCINTSDEETLTPSSCDSETDSPPTPRDYFSDNEQHHIRSAVESTLDEELDQITFEDIASITFSHEDDSWCATLTVPQAMTRTELMLDSFSPYGELCHPRCDFGKILARLLTEWYAVGASLLATAALNAAVFGYSSGTLFQMDGLALRSVTVGSIAGGIGLVIDAWFIMLYSSGGIERFQRLAADVGTSADPSYFYFSLTCRLPTLCLFISAFSLMLFLLTVAWAAWPTAVLVMCFAAGTLLTLQYLVFGVRRTASFIAWLVWTCVGKRRRRASEMRERISVPPVDTSSVAPTPPPPYSSPAISLSQLMRENSADKRHADVVGPGGDTLPPSIGRREEA